MAKIVFEEFVKELKLIMIYFLFFMTQFFPPKSQLFKETS